MEKQLEQRTILGMIVVVFMTLTILHSGLVG